MKYEKNVGLQLNVKHSLNYFKLCCRSKSLFLFTISVYSFPKLNFITILSFFKIKVKIIV